jgi:tripartite tricarboxylate transporter TctB family protein
MRSPERCITSGIMLLVFLFFLVQAMTFGPLARTMPLLISVPGVVFCLAQFVIDLKRRPEEADCQPVFSSGEAKTAAWIMGFILAISLLGFDYGSPLMVAAYLYFYAGERLLTVALAALSCVAFTYGFMNRLMEIQLFEGLLFAYLH